MAEAAAIMLETSAAVRPGIRKVVVAGVGRAVPRSGKFGVKGRTGRSTPRQLNEKSQPFDSISPPCRARQTPRSAQPVDRSDAVHDARGSACPRWTRKSQPQTMRTT
eukprot:scaffold49065_cov54-Phaeocystis_antarctica.AAC.1